MVEKDKIKLDLFATQKADYSWNEITDVSNICRGCIYYITIILLGILLTIGQKL